MAAEEAIPDFRIARRGDAPAILRVLQAAFAEWPRIAIDVSPLEHLEWKMQPPDGLEVQHTVGTIGGEIIAVDLRWMSLTQVGGRVLLTNDGAEKAIHPDYQGRGFNRAINQSEPRLAQSGEMGLAPPNTNKQVARSDRPGTPLGELRTSVRSVGLRATIGSHRAGGRHLLRALPRLVRARRRRFRPTHPFHIEPITHFDEQFEGLWEAVRHEFDLVRVRQPSYLNWRFADPRSGRTVIRAAWLDDELAGYIVFRPAARSATLLDLLVHPAHPTAAVALLLEGAAELEEQGCRSLSASLPSGHPAEIALLAAGFVDADQPVPVRITAPLGRSAVDGHAPVAPRPGRWHVTVGEFEYS